MSNLKHTKTEAKGASGTMKTIFELVYHDIRMEYDENGTIIPPSYPEFEVTKLSLGFYTSLAKSEAAMKRFIKATMKWADENRMGYCYYIHEYLCNSKWGLNTYSCRSYLPNGDLFDANLTPERDLDDEPARFLGRTPEQTRFKEGDIV
ncbi:MAG: hypothetical protein LBL13_00480, partial [Bacteroidales bacterium]|nr:hypothetical protein [Bacteroidales bacterium]